jgi:hypothetical protein
MPARRAGLLFVSLIVFSACGSVQGQDPGALENPESFDAFPLYAPGDPFEESLATVRRRPGYVEFRYESDPPLRVEVWPGCVRNPVLRPGMLVEGEAFEQVIPVRRARGYTFEAGRRIEVPLVEATVVVRAGNRRQAREAARALEGVNTLLTREDPLPGADPEQTEAGCGAFDTEAPLIESKLKDALGLQGPVLLRCGRSLSIARTSVVDDAHDCFSGMSGGEPSFWCVLSRGKELVAGGMAMSCDAAVRADAVAQPLGEIATLGWGLRAGNICEPHLARVPEVLAGLDQERMISDFSYVWEVMGSFEAELVADLRSVRVPSAEAEKVLALYEARIEAIRAAVDQYHAGREEKALAELQRIQDDTPKLTARLTTLGAAQCAPPW